MILNDIAYRPFIKPEWENPKRSIRALLIQPPNIDGIKSLLSHLDDTGEGRGLKPPLGLLYIATFLKERTPHQVAVLDAQAQRFNFEQTIRWIQEYKPDIIGISAWTNWWYPAYHLGQLIKNCLLDIHICYGGPHVNIYAEEIISFEQVDSLITGDGEVPFAYLCNMLANQVVDNDFPGLHFRKYGIKSADQRFFIQNNLDDLPIPDRSFLPLERYTSLIGKADFVTTMITSRGCPHRCIFCKLSYQKPVSRSAQNVIEEFRRLYILGIKEVEIYDDTFTWSKQRVIDICQGLIKEGIKIDWAVRDRVNLADSQTFDLMRAAGCSRIHYGIESGVDQIMELIKKNITTEQARSAVKLAKKKGFTVLTYFMMGNKGETIADVKKTIDFSLELDADYAEFAITIPYPGTQMYREALDKGIISYDYWRKFNSNPSPNFDIPKLYEENLTIEELVSFRDEAVWRYYFRPKYIKREILKLKQWSEFQRKAKVGLRLLFSICRKSYQN